MDINDDALRMLWQRQQPPSGLANDMARKVQRHHHVERVRRIMEIALTVVGITLLTWPMADGQLTPGQWLLIPFFSVFLIAIWTALLRQRTDQRIVAHEPTSVYAAIRKLQLRSKLRHLQLARVSALALSGYAFVSLIVCYVFATAQWQDAALRLTAWSFAWMTGTWWLVRAQRKTIRQEYRRVARLSICG